MKCTRWESPITNLSSCQAVVILSRIEDIGAVPKGMYLSTLFLKIASFPSSGRPGAYGSGTFLPRAVTPEVAGDHVPALLLTTINEPYIEPS